MRFAQHIVQKFHDFFYAIAALNIARSASVGVQESVKSRIVLQLDLGVRQLVKKGFLDPSYKTGAMISVKLFTLPIGFCQVLKTKASLSPETIARSKRESSRDMSDSDSETRQTELVINLQSCDVPGMIRTYIDSPYNTNRVNERTRRLANVSQYWFAGLLVDLSRREQLRAAILARNPRLGNNTLGQYLGYVSTFLENILEHPDLVAQVALALHAKTAQTRLALKRDATALRIFANRIQAGLPNPQAAMAVPSVQGIDAETTADADAQQTAAVNHRERNDFSEDEWEIVELGIHLIRYGCEPNCRSAHIKEKHDIASAGNEDSLALFSQLGEVHSYHARAKHQERVITQLGNISAHYQTDFYKMFRKDLPLGETEGCLFTNKDDRPWDANEFRDVMNRLLQELTGHNVTLNLLRILEITLNRPPDMTNEVERRFAHVRGHTVEENRWYDRWSGKLRLEQYQAEQAALQARPLEDPTPPPAAQRLRVTGPNFPDLAVTVNQIVQRLMPGLVTNIVAQLQDRPEHEDGAHSAGDDQRTGSVVADDPVFTYGMEPEVIAASDGPFAETVQVALIKDAVVNKAEDASADKEEGLELVPVDP
ncbi:uncharacterized protein EV422DRAFT_509784 [Fimicolochytrium jonesii]|uniref:uncharacterized protein n=1 Tax=Fimicolochytrium jonesii TaxID=1396493 RepID=UPI0022FE0616|nr:uncharacterized protein EV422DRAFT_509784 [Fimicolochytrium jonesii]KAI8816361.1 hypothetical protein EV422DRAFT_509784 [Fimicolochytrium jonesii]